MDLDVPTNYPGALIFWAYIVAALGFTGIVLSTIRQSHQQNYGRSNIPIILIILAASSFSTLSYHMLNVLILSYKQWSTRYNIPLGALTGSNRTSLHLWQWSITSSLFQDFGQAIVATKSRYFLSSSGLWSTVGVAVYMGIEGRRCNVPNLWAFFGLLEILPTSFAQSLFYIMLCTKPQSAHSNQRLLSYWPAWFSIPLLYLYCLNSALEYAEEGEKLIYTILLARLLLILPLILPLSSVSAQPAGTTPQMFKHASTLRLFTFTLATQFLTQKSIGGLGSWEEMRRVLFEALNSHPAVQALSYDLMHSVVAFGYWMLRGGRIESEVKAVAEKQLQDLPVKSQPSSSQKRSRGKAR